MIRHKDVDERTTCQGRLDDIGIAVRPLGLRKAQVGFKCAVCKREFLFLFLGEDK